MNTYIIKKLSILLIGIICVASCEDFLDENLEKETVTILAPADNVSITNSTVTFWWEETDGATEYRIQVVTPDFDKIQKLWYDSVVTDNKIQFPLIPGNFQWRIKALNGSSETKFTVASFSIDSTMDISDQTIILLYPTEGYATNNSSIIFKWNKLYNADEYRFTITNSSNEILTDNLTEINETTYELYTDGTYTWSVRGQNASTNTLFSSASFIIDTKKPDSPTLTSPTNHLTISTDSVYFSWTRAADNGSPLFDSLYIFEDSELTKKILAKKIENTVYSDSLAAGNYYWYVKTCDSAGNSGEKSNIYSFNKY